jgi:hypothetical protein
VLWLALQLQHLRSITLYPNSSPLNTPKPFMRLCRPVDFYLGISWTRKRLLEVPCLIHVTGRAVKAIRFEFTLLFSVVLIVDYVTFRVFGRRSRSAS